MSSHKQELQVAKERAAELDRRFVETYSQLGLARRMIGAMQREIEDRKTAHAALAEKFIALEASCQK